MNKLFLLIAFLGFNIYESFFLYTYKTDFHENHIGISFGGGTYYKPQNLLPPKNELSASQTIEFSNQSYLLPLKIGFFMERTIVNIEFAYKYWYQLGNKLNLNGFTSSEAQFQLKGHSASLTLAPVLSRYKYFRLLLPLSIDYHFHNFTYTSELENRLYTSQSYHSSQGLRAEVWLVDNYSFFLGILYHYAWPGQGWKLKNSSLSSSTSSEFTQTSTQKISAPQSVFLEIGLNLNYH